MMEIDAKPALSKKRLQYFYDAMREGKFTDVVFDVGDRKYYAHMAMLSACSKFFETNKRNISRIFSDFDYPVIDAVLKYCYLGEIHIQDEHYKHFLQLANILQIDIFDSKYEKAIIETNCLEVLNHSNDPILPEKANSEAIDNFTPLHKSPDFRNLPASALSDILKSDEINSSVDELFDLVKFWIKYDEENRKSKLVEPLGLENLPPLSIEILKNCQYELSNVKKHIKTSRSELSSAEKTLNSCQSKFSIVEQILKHGHSSFENDEATENDKLALVGDYDANVANTIDIYDGKNDRWTLSEDFQLNRSDFASVLVDHTGLLIIGGSGTTNVDYIDLKSGQKHQLKPLNQSRQWPSAAKICRNSTTIVYAIGGIDSYETRNFLSSVERWSSETKTWDRNVAPLLHAVYFHSAAVIDDIIYVTGGRIKKDGEDSSTNIVQVYSADSNSWSYGTPMIRKRLQHSSVAFKGRLYVGGGTTGETYYYLDSVESYDPNAKLWTIYCKLPKPVRALSICFYRNKLLCMAGHNGQNFLSNVWEYDDKSNNWKSLKSLNKGRHYATAHVIPYDSVI
ncbi:kelch repeat and BTB domain-containing protein 12-like isoform X2 [Arctopsyche grandis]|uniref:kelch repeat and BTB domain-containing protein 12-like isoform X2 n=1 Tax=Arctopsyche grandis TaxID=121162 RepID=UPI00406D98D2